MTKKMLLVLDGQVGVLNRIYRKAETILTINTLIASFASAQQTIVFTRHANKTSLSVGTNSWKLDSTINCPETSIFFDKKRSSVFAEPAFIELLEKENVRTIYVCGFVTNGCVQAACLDGRSKGFDTKLLADAHSTFIKNASHVIDTWNQKLADAGIEVLSTYTAMKQIREG